VYTSSPNVTGRTLGPVRIGAKVEEPPKKRGFTILVWIVIAIGAIILIRYLLQDRVQQSLEDAGTGGTHARARAAETPSSGPVLGASSATAEYNPHGLDPSRSGRLRLELNRIPSSQPVSLEVDGRPFWSGTPEVQNTYTGFLVAAGRHQLRIVASAGAAIISSNSVSADLTPGKRVVLSVQVRPQPAPGAATLDRTTHITLAVRSDAMF
jgi:hypothetical protein